MKPAGSAYLELTKPRITVSVVFTTAAGLWLAPVRVDAFLVLLALGGTAAAVAAANVLNMVLERDSDALMPRTRRRPLPSGRIGARPALLFGLLLASTSIPLLTFAVGAIPGMLAAIALVSYVLLYTPMKRRTPTSLLVGAVAGAMPPLIGWTAATGQIDLPGLLLFAVLFLWQVPHFLAITLMRRNEYARAGLVVQANEPGGEREARRNIVLYTAALIAVSLMFIPAGVGGKAYLVAAAASGALFLAVGARGLRSDPPGKWARTEFLASLAYLAVLLAALLLDRPPVL
jgi:heme o synthase